MGRRSHPWGSAVISPALVLCLALAGCSADNSAPQGAEAAAASTSPAPEAVQTVTYSGHAMQVHFEFDHPARWAVTDNSVEGNSRSPWGPDTDTRGFWTISNDDGETVAGLRISTLDRTCGTNCSDVPPDYSTEIPGQHPLSVSGDFVVRTVVVDLTDQPDIVRRVGQGWEQKAYVSTSLVPKDDAGSDTVNIPYLTGWSLVQARYVEDPDPSTSTSASPGTQAPDQAPAPDPSPSAPEELENRVVEFGTLKSFDTVEEAKTYAASEENQQVAAIIASFRQRTATSASAPIG